MKKEYSFCLDTYLLENEYIGIVESSLLRTLHQMYSDGILTTRPDAVKIVNTEGKLATTKKDIEEVIMYFE